MTSVTVSTIGDHNLLIPFQIKNENRDRSTITDHIMVHLLPTTSYPTLDSYGVTGELSRSDKFPNGFFDGSR